MVVVKSFVAILDWLPTSVEISIAGSGWCLTSTLKIDLGAKLASWGDDDPSRLWPIEERGTHQGQQSWHTTHNSASSKQLIVINHAESIG